MGKVSLTVLAALCLVLASACTPMRQSGGSTGPQEPAFTATLEQQRLSEHWDLSYEIVLDSNNCPRPGTNRTIVAGLELYDQALQKAMGLGSRGQVAELLISASFEAPVSVALEPTGEKKGRDCEYGCELVVVVMQGDLWGEMMAEIARQQGRVMRLGLEQQAAALSALDIEVDTTRVRVDQSVAQRLLGVWTEVLQRTAYPRELLTGPDGSGVGYVKLDGTRYEFSSYGMAGETHSPRAGSLMADYVDLGAQLAAAARGTGEPFWSEVEERLARLETRLQTDEPCEIVVPANR